MYEMMKSIPIPRLTIDSLNIIFHYNARQNAVFQV